MRYCKNLIQEFTSYVWDSKAAVRGEEKPLKENDHALDALRYVMYSHFYGKPQQRLSAEDIDKMHRDVWGGSDINLPPAFRDQSQTFY